MSSIVEKALRVGIQDSKSAKTGLDGLVTVVWLALFLAVV